jgi:hypothetical protein
MGRGSTFGAEIGGGAGARDTCELTEAMEYVFLVLSAMLVLFGGRQLLTTVTSCSLSKKVVCECVCV